MFFPENDIFLSLLQIVNQKLDFTASSKIGSMDNVKHQAGGGNKKVFNDVEYLKQMSESGLPSSSSAQASKSNSRRQSANQVRIANFESLVNSVTSKVILYCSKIQKKIC